METGSCGSVNRAPAPERGQGLPNRTRAGRRSGSCAGLTAFLAGAVEQGVQRLALVPEDETGRCHQPPQEVHEAGQAGRIETECPGRAVTSRIEIGHVLPVLVGDRPQFLGRSPASVPPPRGHRTQAHHLRQPQPERPGLAVQAHVHHRPFLSALSDEAERITAPAAPRRRGGLRRPARGRTGPSRRAPPSACRITSPTGSPAASRQTRPRVGRAPRRCRRRRPHRRRRGGRSMRRSRRSG